MAEGVQTRTPALLKASELAHTLSPRHAPNGVRFTSFGDIGVSASDLERIVQAVPAALAPALADRVFYFVPLALAELAPQKLDDQNPEDQNPEDRSPNDQSPDDQSPAPVPDPSTSHPAPPAADAASGQDAPDAEPTLVAPAYTSELSDEAICHRNVRVPATPSEPAHEGVFISARLLRDQFALAFEFFINVGHAYTAASGVPEPFTTLAWAQALADVRGETSQDAFEARIEALAGCPPAVHTSPGRTFGERRSSESARSNVKSRPDTPGSVDRKAQQDFFESAFADALAIYQLSLSVDFDYSELREREYPLLAPAALAARLRLMAHLYPPNPGYVFSIRYRRRA